LIVKKLPENLLISLQSVHGFDRKAFEEVHASDEKVTSVRLNPWKSSIVNRESSIEETSTPESVNATQHLNGLIHDSRLTIHDRIPWCENGYYLRQRPSFTFDPLFHAGCYYVQEASSMFLEQAVKQLVDVSAPLKVLDLCGAPGGKSTHIQSLISKESLLVSNEVIRSRSNILIDNIIKWGASNVIVTNNDPSAFQKLEGYFDLMAIDAPCSGSGLFRRDEEAIEEWSLNNVQLCSQRQRRILADAIPALKENGLLIYSTCSYSKEEDEEIADWLVDEFEMQNEKLKINEDWNIVESFSDKTNSVGYRFYPNRLKGEGFYLSCFRKTTATREPRIRPSQAEKASIKEKAIIQSWLNTTELELARQHDKLIALPSFFLRDFSYLNSVLNIRYAGTSIGQVLKEKLVPEHALAVGLIISEQVPRNELSLEHAIKYLQRQEFNFNSSVKGWQLVCYRGKNLGWINMLPNRMNNYYPKELRILKSSEDRSFEK
jgi:16S rRNA C967 or C1407 C5-methylase (RsmB/RsmF family)/NOL1/NOP2/fmu family ribosome biogenesis protein